MIIDSHLHVLKKNNFDKTAFEALGHPFPEDTPLELLVGWLNDLSPKN
jgi:hypothetical protein